MAAIAAARKLIDELEVKYRSAISESTWFKIGGALNFIMLRNHQEKQFFLNGPYSIATTPQYAVDGMTVFQYDAVIFNVYMFNLVAGSSGYTELDLRLKPQNSGSFTSIFSTKPRINQAAGANKWVGVGDVIANCTAPIFTGAAPVNVNAGDALILDLIAAQPGAQNCGLLVHYRPR